MKQLISILLSVIAIFIFGGCGSSSSIAKFNSAMVEDQPFYTFDEKNVRWIRVIFDSSSQVIYEILEASEIGGTYTIENGEIVVNDNDKNPIIALDSVQVTLWEVTGIDNDGTIWQDTWHLEQKLTSEMIIGKQFLSEFTKDGVLEKEEYEFTDATVNVYNTDGIFRGEFPYQLEEGVLHVIEDTEEFNLYLMSIEENGDFNIWFSSDIRSGSSVWSFEPKI